jgi:hypothetical protein
MADEGASELHSWHDCHVWRFAVVSGDPAADDWRSELILDLDFIAEWLCGVDQRAQFRVVPATLTFHQVSNLVMNLHWETRNDVVVMLHDIVIYNIDRTPVESTIKPYYDWTIHLSWPQNGEIRFRASGYTQELHGEPVLTSEQQLTMSQRERG